MRGLLLALLALVMGGAPALAQGAPIGPGIEHLAHLLDVVEAQHRATPDPGDVWAQAARLGHDAERLIAFVREEIAFEPYEGLLRGPSGTLLARAGNALDQALLLQALLAAGGTESLLLGRDLAEAEAPALVAAFAARGPVPADPPPQSERAAEALGVAVELVEAVVRERSLRDAALREEVLFGALAAAARLEALVGAELDPAPVAGSRRHYWLEVSGAPVDPTALGLDLAGGSAVRQAELDAAATTLTFRLVLDRATGTDIATDEVLEVALLAHEVVYRPIDLLIYPDPADLPDAMVIMELTAAERAEALRSVGSFRSALLVDGRRHGGLAFDFEGSVQSVGGEPRVAAATAVGGAMGGLFGRATGSTPPPSELHALRLELVVQAPGAEPSLHSRTLYRAGEAPYPMLRESYLIESSLLPAGESARRSLAVLASNADALRWILFGTGVDRDVEPEADVAPLLLEYADARRQLLAALDLAPLYEGVGILRESRQLLLAPGDVQHGLRHVVDIMDARYAFVGADGRYDHAAALRAGAAETALEWLLVMRTNPGGADVDGSAWTLIDRARVLGGQPSVARAGDALQVRWADDAHWSVDARTGLSIGRVESGAGQAMAEYSWTTSEKVCEAMNRFFTLAKEFEVEGQAMSNMEAMCDLRDAASQLDKGLDFLLSDDMEEFALNEIREWRDGKIKDAGKFRDQLFDAIQGQTRSLWRGAAGALAGL